MHRNSSFENNLNSFFIVAMMMAMLGLLGYILAGVSGVVWMAVLGGFMVLFGRRASAETLLKMQGAKPIRREHSPELFDIVAHLSQRAGLSKMPALYYVRSNIMNAFAVGTRDAPAIGVTTALLRDLDRRELTNVLAHEISHVQHNDLAILNTANFIRRLTNGLSTVGKILLLINLPLLLMGQAAVSWVAILLLIFAPTISGLLQLALNRTREFEADKGAVRLTGDALGLALALQKLEGQSVGIFGRFLHNLNALTPEIFRSHPQTTERIRRLGYEPRRHVPTFTV